MISLHPTQPSHADDISALLDRVFGPGFRARTAERLREANRPISALSYIARDDQEALIGSISYWPVRLGQTAGLLLGPLAVDATVQGKGVGLQLMQATLDLVDPARFSFVVLVGDLDYYARVGFGVAPADVRLPGPVDPARLLMHAKKAVFKTIVGHASSRSGIVLISVTRISDMNDGAPTQNALQNVIAQAQKADGGSDGLPPVHLWEPDYCGDIGLHIARDGQWYYAGSPIGRKRLVRLFSTILRHDDDGEHYLVTPVEKIRVGVEDAPFVATLMQVTGSGRDQALRFETNVHDFATAGAEHALRIELDPKDKTPSPYIHIRARLEALISRAVFYDLVALGETVDDQFGVWSENVFFPIAPAADVEAWLEDDA